MSDSQVPLANVVTLGARNVPALRDFYASFGWPVIFDDGDFVAFELRGTVLALFPVDKLAADGRERPEVGQGGIRFTLAVMASSSGEVDELADRFRQAGGRVTKEPVDAEFFEGRSAYVADPEGNYWEIVWPASDNVVTAASRRAAGLDAAEPQN